MTFRKSPSHVVICGPSAHPKPSQAIPDGPRMSPGGRPRSDHWALDRLWPRSSRCLRGSAVSEAPNKRPMHRGVYIVLDLEKRRLFRTDWIVILISADPSRKLVERAGEECSGDRQKDRQTGRQAGRQAESMGCWPRARSALPAMVFWLCETGLWAELCRQCRKAGEWKVWD